jgi:tRNA1(Val) A37 N6-methylase TrmN6
MTEAFAAPCTDDAFLDGRVRILQPASGYRAGIDAVLLAAAAPVAPEARARVLDAGAGVGTVGLCVASRCAGATVVLVEREHALAELARENVRLNGFASRMSVVEADVGRVAPAELERLGVGAESFDHVLANPPFHGAESGTRARDPLKSEAHAMPEGGLDPWMRFLARMARPGGTATVVHKAEALADLLRHLEGRFGGLRVLPVHARAGEPAIRLIVQGVKGSRAPLALLSGFVLHEAGGAFTPQAVDILRNGAGLDLAKSGASAP